MTGNTTNYKTIPALAAYIDRVQAEQLNFKRFMIKEHKGRYYTEKCLIKIQEDGEIWASKKEYAPTEEEKEQIKGALMSAKWPHSRIATEAAFENFYQSMKDSATKQNRSLEKEDFSIFWSRKENGIIMLQQRRHDKKSGEKYYTPWTLWDDGEWRMMEPDGALPFWKPKEKKSNRICIHEGAKAAIYINNMLYPENIIDETKFKKYQELKDQHPWAKELEAYDHWGMIGGALAPHRADYAELWAEKPVEVVYVCDNDWPGKAALEEVSRHWGGSLKGIYFDSNWPVSFDLGDEFSNKTCPKLFKGDRYNGETLLGMMFPATYATEPYYTGESKKPEYRMRRVFREEWVHTVQPEVFIHKDKPNDIFSANEFNIAMAPFTNIRDLANLLQKDRVGKGSILSYEPNRKPGLYGSKEKGYYMNTYVPGYIKKEKGDFAIWMQFLDFLFPEEEDRLEASRWIATLIGRPDIRMLYGMLLVSETQGVGKTTLAEKVLMPLVGAANTSIPGENDIVDSDFNSWIAHKRLAIVSEIYAGHSSKAYDKLKSVITDRIITVNEKYLKTYKIQNWVHILASSNSMRALKMSADDRRWFVPKVTEHKQDWDFWETFNEWLREDGGLNKIKYWAEDVFLKDNDPVKTGDDAPWSTVKQEMVEEGLSPGQLIAANLFAMLKEEMNGSHFIVPDTDVVELIKDKLYEGKNNDKLERPLTIRKLAKSSGLFISKKRHAFKKWGTRETNPRLICSNAELAELSTEDLDALTNGPVDIKDFLGRHGKV